MQKRLIVPGVLALASLLTACGKEEAQSGIPLESNPLAGANQAYSSHPLDLLQSLLVPNAYAAVSSFTSFKVCVSEIVWELQSGTAGSSSTAPLKPGLLDFSPTSTEAKSIGNLDLEPGAVLKNIKFTIATKPDLCGGADYAVAFSAASTGGEKKVTQDMSFRFDFSGGAYTVAEGQKITLLLGDIVNGMVSLGASLDNSSIQTVNVGQAK